MKILLDLQGAQSESRFRGIGRYTLALAQAIARESRTHEVWLALNSCFPEAIESLRAKFKGLVPPERIRVFEIPAPVNEQNPANHWRMRTAELIREKFLADLRPDFVHLSTLFEGFADNVVASIGLLNESVPTAATLYDLIPLLNPEEYLRNPIAIRSHLRRALSLKRAQLLLAISESSRQESIAALDIAPHRIINIGAGLDPCFYSAPDLGAEAKSALMDRYGLTRRFVLYVGGADPRKNLGGLITAFGLLPKEVRAGHQLGIAGKFPKAEQRQLLSTIRKTGLGENDVVFLGYVPDEDLRLLYNSCALSVLPSLHEGFGLPVLEAMGCGAPVIGSNCTSIPEIIDREDALFDPRQPREMADRIAAVLSNPVLREDLKSWGLNRAKGFTWEACAKKALDAFESVHAERQRTRTITYGTSGRPLLAFVSPLPLEATKVADYSARLLPSLARHYEIVCIVDQAEVLDPWITADFPIRDLRWFERHADDFQRILYQFADSPCHKHLFALLARHPGISVLHDFRSGTALNWMERSDHQPRAFTEALYESHGYYAVYQDQLKGREATIAAFPANAVILRDSIGVIVHSEDFIQQTQIWYGQDAAVQTVFLDQSQHAEKVAEVCRDRIEEFYRVSCRSREQRLIQAIARLSDPIDSADKELPAIATAIAANRTRFGLSQILIDVSNIADARVASDAPPKTPQVIQTLLTRLLTHPPPGYRVEPVRVLENKFVYARRFTCQFLQLTADHLSDEPVESYPGDIIFGLAWRAGDTPNLAPWLLKQGLRGVRVVFAIHDPLPSMYLEQVGKPNLPPEIQSLNTIFEIADGLICGSPAGAETLYGSLIKRKPQRLRTDSLAISHFEPELDSHFQNEHLPKTVAEISESASTGATLHLCDLLLGKNPDRRWESDSS
jgi:glycosyltransferase involved in cell wall biosynthesis